MISLKLGILIMEQGEQWNLIQCQTEYGDVSSSKYVCSDLDRLAFTALLLLSSFLSSSFFLGSFEFLSRLTLYVFFSHSLPLCMATWGSFSAFADSTMRVYVAENVKKIISSRSFFCVKKGGKHTRNARRSRAHGKPRNFVSSIIIMMKINKIIRSLKEWNVGERILSLSSKTLKFLFD